ncbi:MAG: Gfo/Idh/MocA family oxidoreductase, partial [Rhodothermales bacterium]
SSYERIPGYTEEVREMGVEIVDSIPELLAMVDVVLLETNDGKPHREQAMQVIEAGKPLFIDKPVAADLADVLAIYDAAEETGVPLFSSSSLRYMEHAQDVRSGSIGSVRGAFTYSPAALEPSHVDLYWYGIHGVEALFTVMGSGCARVVRTFSDGAEVTTCRWADGRIGTFYGIREGRSDYGGTAFGDSAVVALGPYGGYEPLVEAILAFFETGTPPVPARETIEIYAFMSAADESRRRGGAPVSLEEVIRAARAEASPE